MTRRICSLLPEATAPAGVPRRVASQPATEAPVLVRAGSLTLAVARVAEARLVVARAAMRSAAMARAAMARAAVGRAAMARAAVARAALARAAVTRARQAGARAPLMRGAAAMEARPVTFRAEFLAQGAATLAARVV